ncbi:hypothetical protein BaRGS_00022707 [Batillaria attramentaria]|uniref:Uncharacterized protein n=1 Tax=Batillaria attramentaria TaxID=370345 RepID=A0ABD0KFU8_9CAEN
MRKHTSLKSTDGRLTERAKDALLTSDTGLSAGTDTRNSNPNRSPSYPCDSLPLQREAGGHKALYANGCAAVSVHTLRFKTIPSTSGNVALSLPFLSHPPIILRDQTLKPQRGHRYFGNL